MFYRWRTVAGPVMDATRRPMTCVAIVNCHDKTLAAKMAPLKFVVKDIEGSHRITVDDPEAIRRDAGLTGESHMTELTPRQHQVLTLFANGLRYKQIARDLGSGSTKRWKNTWMPRVNPLAVDRSIFPLQGTHRHTRYSEGPIYPSTSRMTGCPSRHSLIY